MSNERKKVLEMLSEGKISVEEAQRLLERLEPGPRQEASGGESGADNPRRPKFLRVVVHDSDHDQVNIRLPLALVRTGVRLSAMLPKEADLHLRERGIDLGRLSELDSEELIDALRELTVDVDSADGDTVRIFCE